MLQRPVAFCPTNAISKKFKLAKESCHNPYIIGNMFQIEDGEPQDSALRFGYCGDRSPAAQSLNSQHRSPHSPQSYTTCVCVNYSPATPTVRIPNSISSHPTMYPLLCSPPCLASRPPRLPGPRPPKWPHPAPAAMVKGADTEERRRVPPPSSSILPTRTPWGFCSGHATPCHTACHATN